MKEIVNILKSKFGDIDEYAITVSYTHLDVYKRQAYTDSNNPPDVGTRGLPNF